MNSPFIKAMLEGMQRLLARLVVKKTPITPAMLEVMVEDAKKNCSLADLRLTTAVCSHTQASCGSMSWSTLSHMT